MSYSDVEQKNRLENRTNTCIPKYCISKQQKLSISWQYKLQKDLGNIMDTKKEMLSVLYSFPIIILPPTQNYDRGTYSQHLGL
jgi:hypothetical protein